MGYPNACLSQAGALVCNSRERSGLGITDLGDAGDVRTVRVNEIIQGKQSEKNF